MLWGASFPAHPLNRAPAHGDLHPGCVFCDELDPSNGYAHIVLAQAYAEGAVACEGFDRQTVYWLAYDVLASARSLFDSGSPEQQQIDQTMALFRRSFPSNDELFFRGLTKAGMAYDVKCGWISGRTTVKMLE